MKKIRTVLRKKIDLWIFQWKCSKIKGKDYGEISYSECLNAQYISSIDDFPVNTLPYPAEVIKLYHSRYTVDGTGIESIGPIFYPFIKNLNIKFKIRWEQDIAIPGISKNTNTNETNLSDVVVPNNTNDFIIKYIDNDELVQIKVFNFDIYSSYLNKFSKSEDFDIILDIPLKSMFDIWMRNTLEELTQYSEISREKIIK